MKLSKKGLIEHTELLELLIILAIIVVMIVYAGYQVFYTKKNVVSQECISTMMMNSKTRFNDISVSGLITGEGKELERAAVICDSLPDLNIKYSDVKSKSNTKAAMKYYIMKLIAEDMRSCHHRYIGDVPDAVPFSNKDGVYCGVCRKFSFDYELKREFNINSLNQKSEKIDYFMTFLMNTKIPATKQYYSEYLYGFNKGTSERIDFIDYVKQKYENEEGKPLTADQIAAIQKWDFTIDPSKDYYVMHFIIKGDDKVADALQKDKQDIQIKAGVTAGVCATAKIVTLVSASTGQLYVTLFSGALTLGCYAGAVSTVWSFFNPTETEGQTMIRYTTLMPVENLKDMKCSRVYGLEKEDIKQPKKV
jgi:hypothetical protein